MDMVRLFFANRNLQNAELIALSHEQGNIIGSQVALFPLFTIDFVSNARSGAFFPLIHPI